MALRGLAALLFGIVILLWPGITLGVLILVYGAYALVDGIVSIFAAIRSGTEGHPWGALLFRGILGTGAGLVVMIWPGLSALALGALAVIFVMSFTAIMTGAFEVVAAFRLRNEISGAWALGLAGLISIGFGLIMVIVPRAGAVSLVRLIGLDAIFLGAALMALAFRLRDWHGNGSRR